MRLQFVETRAFTRRIAELGLEPELRALQEFLLQRPEAGPLDPDTGGLRKMRMATPCRGKRGGARVHYLHLESHQLVYLIFVYVKTEQATLSPSQKRQLRSVVEQIRREWEARR